LNKKEIAPKVLGPIE